jgi:hypothetical protein
MSSNRNRNSKRYKPTPELIGDVTDTTMVDEVDSSEDINRFTKLSSLITEKVEEPFPFTSVVEGQLIHLKLPRPEIYPKIKINHPVNQEMFDKTIKWLVKNLWFNENPYVHGDLTETNLIVTPGKLWIIDYQPGLFIPADNIYQIFLDYADFITSISFINRACVKMGLVENLEIDDIDIHKVADKLSEAKDSPLPNGELDMVHFYQRANLTQTDEELVRRVIDKLIGYRRQKKTKRNKLSKKVKFPNRNRRTSKTQKSIF